MKMVLRGKLEGMDIFKKIFCFFLGEGKTGLSNKQTVFLLVNTK